MTAKIRKSQSELLEYLGNGIEYDEDREKLILVGFTQKSKEGFMMFKQVPWTHYITPKNA